MSAIKLVVILLTLLGTADAVKHVAAYPRDGSYDLTFSGSRLIIDCSHSRPHIDEDQLSRQLDSMLSADHFVDDLTSLSINNTPVTRVPASVCKLNTFNSLILHNNKLTELHIRFNNLAKPVTLEAGNKATTRLQDRLFEGLQGLLNLYLPWNQIAFIGLRVFSNSSDLISLRVVDLAHNRLTSIEPWWYYRCILSNKTTSVGIDFHSKLISKCTNKLKFEFACRIKITFGNVRTDHNHSPHNGLF